MWFYTCGFYLELLHAWTVRSHQVMGCSSWAVGDSSTAGPCRRCLLLSAPSLILYVCFSEPYMTFLHQCLCDELTLEHSQEYNRICFPWGEKFPTCWSWTFASEIVVTHKAFAVILRIRLEFLPKTEVHRRPITLFSFLKVFVSLESLAS